VAGSKTEKPDRAVAPRTPEPDAPQARKRPGVTKKPGVAKQPGVTKKPGVTKRPGVTKQPGAAKKPGTASAPSRPRRGRESMAARRDRTAEIVRRLYEEYPDARCSLDHRNAYELLTATILSAQCTDERVNMVTPALFRRYPAPVDLAGARQEEVEELIRSTGFFRNKAKSLLGMAGAVTDQHAGEVPRTMDELVALPGVGRKTANVVLGNAFGIDEGVVVDTHVKRLSGRLGLSTEADPEKIEVDLMKVVDRAEWTDVSHLFIYHGRAVCKAPTPRCEACVLADICPSSRV
jgi:endonuclease III